MTCLVSAHLTIVAQSLFAYRLEALAPTSSHHIQASETSQKLSDDDDVMFFNTGTVNGRTLVVYKIKKKNVRP